MSVWLSRHLQTAIGSLGRLSQQPLGNLLTILVIGIALALPASLQMLVSNAQSLSADWQRALEMSAYLKTTVSSAHAEELTQQLQRRPDVAAVKLIKADDGLQEFREYSGFGAALDALTENPLPHVIVITPAAADARTETLAADLERLSAELRKLPEVESVQLDTVWVQRLTAILDALRRATLLIAGLLAIGVMIIISNTIRLDIQNRRDEIEVAKLVGASNAFVRRPFLYEGFWYGLGGSGIALLIVTATVWLLRGPVDRIAALYGSAFTLQGLAWPTAAALLGVGVTVGWLGSLVSTRRHLKNIEPR